MREYQTDPADAKIEAYVSEFVGSFFLVLTVGFNVLQNTALAPISIGSMLMAMIFATGKVSGGHFNPAVTLGVYCRGKIEGGNACGYVAVQLLGGMVGGVAYLAILSSSFSLQPGFGYGLGSVFIVEMLFTAALVFVVLSVATTVQDDGNWYYGLAIGLTVMSAAFAIGPISGCSLNPAVTFGVLFSNFLHTGYLRVSLLVLYTVAPLCGALLAVALFGIVREQEYLLPQVYRHEEPRSPIDGRPFALPVSGSGSPVHYGSPGTYSGERELRGRPLQFQQSA